jgi:hypothetical protein
MRRRIPFIALWSSLAYLIAAMGVTSKLCFDQLRAFSRGAAEATGPFAMMTPAWVMATADAAQERLWWLCASSGLGILLVALCALWVSLSSSESTA